MATLGSILVILGATLVIFEGLDAHLGAFSGPLGSTFGVFGWLGGHFGDSLLTFIGNVESRQIC